MEVLTNIVQGAVLAEEQGTLKRIEGPEFRHMIQAGTCMAPVLQLSTVMALPPLACRAQLLQL